jgi:iron complex outermembrane recepter protein
VRHEDRSKTWVTNEIDLEVLENSLMTEDPAVALNVVSDRPGAGPLPAGLISPRTTQAYVTRATQYGLNLSGRPVTLPAGRVTADLGVARREESVRFDRDIGRLDRDITSIFSHLRVPIIGDTGTPLARSLDLTLGARRDFHSDARDVTSWQYGLGWQPLSAITVHAGYSQLFRPPSLYELYVPRTPLPAQVFDPQRDEPAIVTLVSGGNSSLRPTKGEAIDLGLSVDLENGWKAWINYWNTRMTDRISAVLIQDLAGADASDTVEGRVIRAERTAADLAADRPGRILTLDTTRANFGAIEARGFDFAIEYQAETWMGRITPRLDITHTVDFRYRNLPARSLDITHTVDFRYRNLPARSTPMLERAGVASLYGTVPSTRAVASLRLEMGRLRAFAFARHYSGYKDYSIVEGAATKRRIRDQTLFDIKTTLDIGNHLTLSVGAHNVFNKQPPFAEIGGWEGFDHSQGDLVGREAFFDITGSF